MSTSPLIKVASSAFTNGSALTFKNKKQQNSQAQNFISMNSPLKSTDENEQSPSKIINIYSDSGLFNVGNSYSTVKNAPIIEEEKTHKTYTYSQMPPEEAEKAYCERQKIIKEQIKRTKNSAKFKPNKRIDPNKPTLKSALKKQQLDYSTAQSQQIDISRTSQTFRRKSIDQPIQTVPKPHPKVSKIIDYNNNSNNSTKQSQVSPGCSNVLQQSFHQQLQSKKQQLLNEIAQLDKEIGKEKEKKQQKSLVQSINISPRVQQRKQIPAQKDDMKSTYEKRQQMKKVADKEKQNKDMEQCTFKPQISSNTSRKLNTSQSSKFTPLTSPKQTSAPHQVKVPRSQSQEEKNVRKDGLQNSKEDLNQRLQRMNEKYNLILEQSNKIRNQLKQI
ncbi:unnamed protein product [Paramecium sonneborni]|uniref:Uncharacterized protein n=1 Tax=Paramecium sonneborni TaxID=65129 RepID=A0A8S1Q7K2_9CILI|nr:unnamed protein product [Paramecium sonneborni]